MASDSSNPDYIVIGGGSSGAVLAARLTEDANIKVVLIEAGGEQSNPWIHVPLGYGKLFRNPAVNWMYSGVPEPGLNDRTIYHPRGKVLGGSSAVNGLLYVRGQRDDFDHWAQIGCRGWSFDDILPYFRKAERRTAGGNEFRGDSGPQPISLPQSTDELCDAYIDAWRQDGLPYNEDFNGSTQEGTGYYESTQLNGIRYSTASSYLRKARRRSNLKIITHALATRIVFDGKRAVGIRYERHGQEHEIRATREVVISTGAIATPQLLELSGIGDGDRLNRLGVSVVHHSPAIGERFQDHLQVRCVYESNSGNTVNARYNNVFHRLGIGIEYALKRTGPLAVAGAYAGCFYRTENHLDTPDMQSLFIMFSVRKMGDRFDDFSGFTATCYQLRPESRGHVHAISPDIRQRPAIFGNYLATETDRRVTIEGLRRLRKIMRNPAMARHVKREVDPAPDTESDEQLLAYIRSTASTVYHPSSTCAMGARDGDPCDPQLRVRGVSGLRVCDASVIPAMTSGNLNAVAIMIGEKTADLLKTGQ
ncbi:choline dehydrogenase [Rhizobium lusitanum]|uniref:Choline dehydrogenase n=1 Tax=Rhizobium lusitanum TaxID=293958 RepID=A0A6L9UH30_9HYPH|nr:GMC family oxidoreductase N-terminal domain-containing protein [Rhizobium lusitanum]NEI73662.1 choline dehydrogenase [Rhizobium lusitanum]